MKITDVYYFSGTHWDREWYQTFQGYRYRLVSLVDEMLDYLEKEERFGVFHLDGQTIVLEDYLEIAPENEGRLKKLIQDGRIKIGPWYNMPDEFLLSGESLIRNLMTGHKICKKWGVEPWKIGYICDIFGHIAQMPQIFNGFDIDFTVLGRGTTETDEKYYNWEAPDGSSCVMFLLEADGGYGNIIKLINTAENDEDLKAKLKADIDSKAEKSNTPVLILMDALDHNTIHMDTPHYIDIIKDLYPDVNVHHCNLEAAAAQLSQMSDKLPTKVGELNKTAIYWHTYLHLIQHTISSYYTIKKANDECQNRLEKRIEPMALFAALNGNKIRRTFVDTAYKYLMQNHPHDSICGCSIEQVHKDMVYRFDQVKEIADILEEEFLYSQRPPKADDHNYLLRLYNPLPFERKQSVTVDVILEDNFPNRFADPGDFEFISSFKLYDAFGNEIPYERLEIAREYKKRVCRLNVEKGELYTITFEAYMPPCGYSEYKLVPSKMCVRYLERFNSGINFAENDFVRMEITSDGEICILDKKTKKEYKNLCNIVDDGEIGDGWYHINPVNDKIVYSIGNPARIEKIENGSSRCVFRITKYIEVPAKLEKLSSGRKRSDEYVKVPLEFEVGLSKSSRYVDAKLTIDNVVKDHRMRLIIPTGVEEKKYFAGQAFCCNTRSTGIDYSTQEWREFEPYEKQMNGIVGMREKNGDGIAFVSAAGLHDCGGYDDGNILITLLRTFQNTVNTVGEPGGQLIGKHSFNFFLVPLDKDVTYSELVKLQDIMAVGTVCVASSVAKDYVAKNESFMQIDGDNLNLSVIKVPESGEDNTAIIRVFNASDKTAEGKLIFNSPVNSAYTTNLNEEVLAEVKADGKELKIKLDKWKIQTYKIKF